MQQAPLWRDLLDRVNNSRFAVVGLVGDKEEKAAVFAHANGLGYFKTRTPLPILFLNSEALGRYKLTATPTTLLIREDGKVEHAWVGKWDDATVIAVASALNLGN